MSAAVNVLFSVVLVNWNSKSDLQACLESLLAQTEQGFEIVVIDNGSTDGSVELVQRQFPGVNLVEAGENLGFAEGCNRGIGVARGEWVVMLNNDTTVKPDWAAELRRAIAAADARVGMIQCKMVFKSRPDVTNSTGIILFSNGTARDRSYEEPADATNEATEIFCATAGAALYRRSMLEETKTSRGYFDRAYFMYCEDLDLGWRCRLAGWSAHYCPSAVVMHAFQASSKRVASDFVEWHCRKNRAATLLKNASWRFIALSLPRTLKDMLWVLQRRGFAGLDRYLDEAASAAQMRGELEHCLKVARSEVERRWVGR